MPFALKYEKREVKTRMSRRQGGHKGGPKNNPGAACVPEGSIDPSRLDPGKHGVEMRQQNPKEKRSSSDLASHSAAGVVGGGVFTAITIRENRMAVMKKEGSDA